MKGAIAAISNKKESQQQHVLSLAEARRVVLTHGWNSTSYQILNPGIRHWFAGANDAVTGFVSCYGVRVAAGAPICAKKRLTEVAAEFEQNAARDKERVCYFCAEARLASFYANSSEHAKVLLGAQPVWKPQNWTEITAKHKSLRPQFNRAMKFGFRLKRFTLSPQHSVEMRRLS